MTDYGTLKARFQTATSRLGLTDKNLLAFAEMFYMSGAASADEATMRHIGLPSLLATIEDGIEAFNRIQDNSLTSREAQVLQDGMRRVLNDGNDVGHELRFAVKELYKAATPDHPAGQYAFAMLNIRRDELRKFKQEFSKLAFIQNKLKKIARKG